MNKFKDATSLLNGYNNLEREFTKKCQELSEIKRAFDDLHSKKEAQSIESFNDDQVCGEVSNIKTDLQSANESNIPELKTETSKTIDNVSNNINRLSTFEETNCEPLEIKSVTSRALEVLSDGTNNESLENVDKSLNSSTEFEEISKISNNIGLNENAGRWNKDDKQSVPLLGNKVSGEDVVPAESEKASSIPLDSKFLTNNWKKDVAKFVTSRPEAKPYLKEIAKILIDRKEIASLSDCLNVAYGLALAKSNPASVNSFNSNSISMGKNISQNNLENDVVNQLGDKDAVKKEALNEYFEKLKTQKKSSPQFLGGNSSSFGLTPNRKITTFGEASNFLLKLLNKN